MGTLTDEMLREVYQQQRAPGCDAPSPAPTYFHVGSAGERIVCRCTVCSRCGRHTGNNTQGHWWALCKARLARGLSIEDSTRQHHFCCPDDCELEA